MKNKEKSKPRESYQRAPKQPIKPANVLQTIKRKIISYHGRMIIEVDRNVYVLHNPQQFPIEMGGTVKVKVQTHSVSNVATIMDYEKPGI